MNFTDSMDSIGKVIDSIGVAIIVIGIVSALFIYLGHLPGSRDRILLYKSARKGIGRAILLGLEFLIAGDIIRTVATTPSFESVGILGLIILIRAFLSVTLELETEGRWPWTAGAGTTVRSDNE